MKIGNKPLGNKIYIIAEAGMNHGGSIERARELIKAAADAGASAIKFQTYTAEELVAKHTPRFWSYHEDVGKDQFEAYRDIPKLNYADYPALMQYAEECGIEFLSTPFSFEAADFLNSIGMKAFKIASSDMSHLPFLEHVARFGKPILLSTGASTLAEVQESVRAIQAAGNDRVVVMHCTLCYPTKPEWANLRVIRAYHRIFRNEIIGLSDHTLGTLAPPIAVAYGAKVIEKHFTTDKTLKGNADHWLSVDPTELKKIVDECEEARQMLGTEERDVFPCERETRKYDKRSIVSREKIIIGTTITEDMITYKRPGTGLWPKHARIVIGSRAAKTIPADTPIMFEDIE